MENLKIAIEAYEDYRLDEAEQLIQKYLKESKENHDVAYAYLGRIRYKWQKFGEAINMYNKALEINPDYEFAKTGITLIDNITAIRNTFYFENAYTDDEIIPNL